MAQFATAITCVDGRVQLPVMTYVKHTQGVDYVDMLTAPGVNKVIAEGIYLTTTELLKKSAEISIDKHGSRLIAIAGHHDCSANPSDKDANLKQLLAAVRIVDSWALNARVIGLWVNEQWKVSQVKDETKNSPRTSSFTGDVLIEPWLTKREATDA